MCRESHLLLSGCIYRNEAQRGERIRFRVIRATTGNRTSDSRVSPDTGRLYFFGDPSAKTENFNDQSVLAADRVQIDQTRGEGSLLRREHDRVG